ncbi:S8 family peptidase [Yersinia ruckeri]|uniref:S8 family peptidase n=1 Tax=Yersinia ruckeri TaxID=29486 RepID=UPI0005386115|nr:S8 family peptidase [Yersinia ruckeri]MCW6528011.1 S8 family peptidase [Yersinia ruckeri]MCW6563183.1 S8 family peptidase [Yersinia ruckeri]UZY05121.1 S8 family peptidase [Yersinia ruckeri]WMS06804.1 S8 family peptidase [Yersinia ruckeri]
MTEQTNDKRLHITLPKTSTTQPYTAHSLGRISSGSLPERDRLAHGQALNLQLQQVKAIAAQAREGQSNLALISGIGVQVEFVGQPDVALAFESLRNEKGRDKTKHIELLSIHQEGGVTSANVYIPDGKITHFENYIQDYLTEKRRADGVLVDHKSLINTLSTIRLAGIKSLWTDDLHLLPDDLDEAFWWEVWLPVRGNRNAVVADFHRISHATGCHVSEHKVDFPERTITWMFGSQSQFAQARLVLNCVAELRRAKDTAEFFEGLPAMDQQLWVDDALQRLRTPSNEENVPYICLLDSGINRGHVMLAPVLHQQDMHTVNDAWGKNDTANHGTGLAGIAIYGDMFDAMASSEAIEIGHRLESVKLTPNHGANAGDAQQHAYLFSSAVTRPEILNGQRRRIFSSAVTATAYRDFGRPSAWSSMVDSLAVDALADNPFPRLFVLSAGNINDRNHWRNYPASLSVNQIHDPGQSWNAITVGAFTNKTELNEPEFTPVAGQGALSPFTTTSIGWDSVWPFKPDVVFEGGNAASNTEFVDNFASLELLTTSASTHRQFWTTNATSAASALCARMAAQLMAQYPALRPETIRALITHSAQWTPAMLRMYPARNKSSFAQLIRHCGWGSPDVERALWSVKNSLSLIAEDSLHPYHKTRTGIKTCDLNLHALPWPLEQLQELQNTQIELRVTLSYFIEPNPSARGGASKYHYSSHRLRFAMKRQTESLEEFKTRINAAAESEENDHGTNGNDDNWLLGATQRHKGSLHQDIWRGPAAELANCGYLAVYPGQGWWRTRGSLQRHDSEAKYSLIVSIHAPDTDVDLYAIVETLVENLINNPIETNV